jgi:hypothetical protein
MINGSPEYFAIYQIDCAICGATPCVALRSPSGQFSSTGLCGSHFFGDRTMMDPSEWNRPAEATE